jgi:NADH-quinone oxidoreductase subunit N
MIERLTFLHPEIALFLTTCVVMVLGLSRALGRRRLAAPVTGLGLLVAAYLSWSGTPTGPGLSSAAGQLLLPFMPAYAKTVICLVSLPILMLLAGTVDRAEEERVARGARFEALRANRAEFYSFFLFSITGLLLCASADDLIWLFLALELTSLPTYIMVTMSSRRGVSQEAGVKYFFLGALGAAIFLYGFALIYGGTGSTNFNQIHQTIVSGGLNSIALLGFMLSIVGLGFKIAAVPMHFYTADVYQGAAPQVSAMLAFVPKTAGFLGLLLLLSTIGWNYSGDAMEAGKYLTMPKGEFLPEPIRILLWVMAALTMTVGNVLAVLQSSVKRMLAYSSIAHSGYMLVGLVAGPGDGSFAKSGLSAVLFYLMSYGVMNVGAFAVLACLERPARRGEDEPREIDHVDDLRGLWQAHPALAVIMSVSALSLLGLPPLLGFFGKVPLFTSAINSGEIALVVILGLNSAIAAFYYLRLAGLPYLTNLESTIEPTQAAPFASRRLAGLISVAGIIVLAVGGNWVAGKAEQAGALSGRPERKTELNPSAKADIRPPAIGSGSGL